jgi:hypothetical protein
MRFSTYTDLPYYSIVSLHASTTGLYYTDTGLIPVGK